MFERVKIRVKEPLVKEGKVYTPESTYEAEIWGNYFRIEKRWDAPSGILIPKEKAEIVV